MFFVLMIFNRFFFKENLEVYRFADLVKDNILNKVKLESELKIRKEKIDAAYNNQYINNIKKIGDDVNESEESDFDFPSICFLFM